MIEGNGHEAASNSPQAARPSPVNGVIPPVEHQFTSETAALFGRKGGLISGQARKKLRENPERLSKITDGWLDRAEIDRGDLSLLLEYVEGKPKQTVSVETSAPTEIGGVEAWQ